MYIWYVVLLCQHPGPPKEQPRQPRFKLIFRMSHFIERVLARLDPAID